MGTPQPYGVPTRIRKTQKVSSAWIVYECELIVIMLFRSEGNVMIAAEESEQQQGSGEVREEPQDLQKGGDMSDSELSLNTSETSLATFSATTPPWYVLIVIMHGNMFSNS